jgi:hypothetical protein
MVNFFSSYATLLAAFITGLIGPLIVYKIKTYWEKKNKPDMVKDTLKVSELVMSKIEHIREEFEADRVWITQFHNGGHFYPTGKSMAKFSMIYECVAPGVASIQQNFQNIPVNLFSRSINHLLQNETIEIPDFKNEEISTYGLKYIAEDTGCKSGYAFAIKTIDDKFIGTLGIDFTKKKNKLDVESINHLSVQASSIGGVLMGYLNK